MAGLVAMTVMTVLLAQAIAGRSAGSWVTYFPPSRLAEFALGILLALEVRDGRWPSVGVPRAALMALGAALAAGVWADIRYSVVITVVPYVLLIGAAADHDRAGQTSALHRGWLVRLGLWSYALYLVHGVVLNAARPHGPPDRVVVAAGLWVLLTGVSLLGAGLLFHLCERPLERRLRPGRSSRAEVNAPAVSELLELGVQPDLSA